MYKGYKLAVPCFPDPCQKGPRFPWQGIHKTDYLSPPNLEGNHYTTAKQAKSLLVFLFLVLYFLNLTRRHKDHLFWRAYCLLCHYIEPQSQELQSSKSRG